MIHVLTTNQSTIVPSKLYSFCTQEDVIKYLDSVDTLSLDTETTGFDPHKEKMLCIQLGDEHNQYVIDCAIGDISFLKPYLENKIIYGQNLKFDLKFLYRQGIYPRKIWDTFIAERVINCGDKLAKAALDVLTAKYLGITLDKSVRADIGKEGLSERVIKYAADDIKYLPQIQQKQLEIIKEQDLLGAINIENRFTPCLAYIEYCGFKLDTNKWKNKMEKDNLRYKDAEAKLNSWVMTSGMQKFISSQLDLFEPVSCSINWASSQQVIVLFEDLGIDCTVVEKGVTKKSIEASYLVKYEKKYEIVKLYLEYKKAEKVVSTYGENFLKQINPVTQRIHTQFKQVLDTGRISSGGKDKSTGEAYVNFQNIPSDKETRACFVAEPGNTLIISDYSGQEQIVLANRALDANILKFYDEKLYDGDMHTFVASKMYPEIDGLTLAEIKSNHSDKRQEAKIAGFAINYGGVGQTIADQLGKSLEDGNRVYSAYFQAFPGLKSYFDNVKKQGLSDGFILINNVTRRKSYLPFFSEYKELEKQMNKDFWEKYRYAKTNQSADFPELKDKVSKYFMYKGDIERKSLNFPIQGSSAEITKISCVYIYDHIIDNNLFGTVKFVNTVHDENVLECPVAIQDEISEVVREAMCRAGEIFCKRVPLKASPELSTFWKK